MGIRSEIKKRLFSYYLKKRMRTAIKELQGQYKAKEADISNAILDINRSILILKKEVDMFSEAVDFIEMSYGKDEKAAEISTIFPFLSLSMLDILILSKQFLCANDIIEKNFVCRTAGQHMYEFLEDGSKSLGKQMNLAIGAFNNQQIDNSLKDLRKLFNALRDDLHLPLKILRHNVSGHKDRDIRKQLKISNAINLEDFQEYFSRFMVFFMTLIDFKRLVVDEIKKKQDISQ